MSELPANSGITSRVEGEELVLTIPPAARGGWGWTAGMGFLAITFLAQGAISGRLGWSIAGLACGVGTIWRLPAILKGLVATRDSIFLRIGADNIVKISGSGEAMATLRLKRAQDVTVRGRRLELCPAGSHAIALLLRRDPLELEWIAEQIRHRWNGDVDGPRRE